MQKDIPSQIEMYLQKRADKKWLSYKNDNQFKTVIVIPAIKEYENIPKLIKSLSQNDKTALQKTLLLFVINNSDVSSDDIKEDNAKTLSLLKEIQKGNSKFNISFIDASSKGRELPSKNAGVGLARKIGMDQALLYFDYLSSGNSIVCLDCDCEVDTNYLTEIQKYFNKNYKAAVVKYEHKLDNEAIINYEIFLRYYVLGLKIANSPYAYHSIGSCIVIDPFTYVKIGGMNKKKAGEDFYFLEKAAKVVDVKTIHSTTVYPSSRKSWRVPFGTGKRITRFFSKTELNDNVNDEYILYDPKSFLVLKRFLSVYLNNNNQSPVKLLKIAKSISKSLHQFLIETNFESNLQRINENAKTDVQLSHQKKIWFDAFKTLKLIHYSRDNGYPEKAMFAALNEMFDLIKEQNFEKFISDSLPPIEKQKEYLQRLRNLT